MMTPSAPLPDADVAADEQRVRVQIAGTSLVQNAGENPGRPARVYSFALMVGGMQVHQLFGRFSELRSRCNGVLGSFPSRHIFSGDYTQNEANVAKRAEELRGFFEMHLNKNDQGSVVGSRQTLSALGIAPGTQAEQALAGVAAARRRAADEKRARAAARLAAIDQQQRADCAHAQEFNSLVAYSNIPVGQLTTIAFPHKLTFELRNRWWGWGDASITGPGGHPWFQMQRTNPSLFGEAFKNCQFTICTMRGEPLLLLQETFHWASYEYGLFRIDPRTRQPIPVCRILRQWGNNFLRVTDQYDVELFPAMAGLGFIQAQGRWPNQFTLSANGIPVATVDKQLFSLTDKYHVGIEPNCDVLLFIGIACAIDRIHHEVEDRRRRD